MDITVTSTSEAMPARPSRPSLAYEVIRPLVVRIVASAMKSAEGEGVASGRGVVIDENGIILTALHVTRGATSIRVIFSDGSESEASVIVSQPENDLAALQPKLLPDDLIPATLTGPDTLNVGDEVAPRAAGRRHA